MRNLRNHAQLVLTVFFIGFPLFADAETRTICYQLEPSISAACSIFEGTITHKSELESQRFSLEAELLECSLANPTCPRFASLTQDLSALDAEIALYEARRRFLLSEFHAVRVGMGPDEIDSLDLGRRVLDSVEKNPVSIGYNSPNGLVSESTSGWSYNGRSQAVGPLSTRYEQGVFTFSAPIDSFCQIANSPGDVLMTVSLPLSVSISGVNYSDFTLQFSIVETLSTTSEPEMFSWRSIINDTVYALFGAKKPFEEQALARTTCSTNQSSEVYEFVEAVRSGFGRQGSLGGAALILEEGIISFERVQADGRRLFLPLLRLNIPLDDRQRAVFFRFYSQSPPDIVAIESDGERIICF